MIYLEIIDEPLEIAPEEWTSVPMVVEPSAAAAGDGVIAIRNSDCANAGVALTHALRPHVAALIALLANEAGRGIV